MKPQQYLQGPAKLLNPDGSLTQAGWARQPVLDANLEDSHFYRIHGLQKLRLKVWDYYAITTPSHFFSFTISDVGYLGMVFAYVIEFDTKEYREQTLTLPFATWVRLPRNSTEGVSEYVKDDFLMRFTAQNDARTISVRWPGFGKGKLNAELHLACPPEHESMTIVIPIRGNRFYYNRKINCMPASGWVEYQNQKFEIDPATCLGSLDWGRGVWEYQSFWVWASASGFLADRRKIGLNLGFGFGDTSAATEDCFILDGKIHKLDDVQFSYNNQNFKAPWSMRSPDGRLDLVFTPFFERVAKSDALVLKSEVHQMFGAYNGSVETEEGEKLTLSNVIGWAEEHHARW